MAIRSGERQVAGSRASRSAMRLKLASSPLKSPRLTNKTSRTPAAPTPHSKPRTLAPIASLMACRGSESEDCGQEPALTHLFT